MTGFLLAYLLFWPVNADPAVWTVQPEPPLKGKFEPNKYLADTEILGLNDGIGPEDIAVDKDGNIYAGYEDGRVLIYDMYGNKKGLFVNTKGRPLGLDFDKYGNLIIADANKGLLSADPKGNLTVLTKEVHGVPYNFTDDVDVGLDGKIYFSDASSKFGIHDYRVDVVEHRPWGRLIMYDPISDLAGTVMGGLYFANGVAVSPEGDFVLVVETTKYRVQKIWLRGEKKGQSEIIIDNLPGFPDGISSNGKGVYWIAMPSLRKPIIDNLAEKPFLRKIALRLPLAFQPSPDRYGFVLGIDGNGDIIYNLQDPSNDSFSPITSVEEYQGMLYLGSLTYPGFARIKVPQ